MVEGNSAVEDAVMAAKWWLRTPEKVRKLQRTLYRKAKANKAKALNEYKSALKLGGSRPLPELFAAAGCKFQFDAATIKPLIQLAGTELKKF